MCCRSKHTELLQGGWRAGVHSGANTGLQDSASPQSICVAPRGPSGMNATLVTALRAEGWPPKWWPPSHFRLHAPLEASAPQPWCDLADYQPLFYTHHEDSRFTWSVSSPSTGASPHHAPPPPTTHTSWWGGQGGVHCEADPILRGPWL